MANVYFDLTRAFNQARQVAALSSGQAVVYYRLAIMSKDGDWIVRDAPDASVRAARDDAGRAEVVAALAQEIDQMQQADRRRLAAYQRAAAPYLAEFHCLALATLPLDRAHAEACRLAQALLPEQPVEE